MNKDGQQPSTEEVDLGQIFNAIGRIFDRFFRFIGSIFKGIFTAFIYCLQVIIDNLLIVACVVGAAFIIGYFTEIQEKPIYESSMLIRPHFDSKYQLLSNMEYYNALLTENNYDVLVNIFDITNEEAKKLVKFDIETGPETKNQLLQQYDTYLKSIDSTRAENVTYNDFVENRDIYSSELYMITVEAYQKDIFRKLENGFKNTFHNNYSIKQKRIRDSILDAKKSLYLRDLQKIDSMQSVYLGVIQKHAENASGTINLQGLVPLQQEKPLTHEYELFRNGMAIRDSIMLIDQMRIEENTYYDVLSRFQTVGSKTTGIRTKNWFIFPFIAFIGLCIVFITFRTFKYVKKYEF